MILMVQRIIGGRVCVSDGYKKAGRNKMFPTDLLHATKDPLLIFNYKTKVSDPSKLTHRQGPK